MNGVSACGRVVVNNSHCRSWTGDVHLGDEQLCNNYIIHQHAPNISPSELSLPRETRRTLAQLRTNKSPILISYLHKVDETHHPSPLSPLCKTPTYHRPPFQLHTPIYLKQYTGPLDVSRESGAPADQVEETPGRASLEKWGCRTPPQLHAGGVGRQQQLLQVGVILWMWLTVACQ